MRFRRRKKLFPGVMLNFSKTGVSTTIGVKGASINLGRAGAFLNTGLPGTGIYDRKRIGAKPTKTRSSSSNLGGGAVANGATSHTDISSLPAEILTSEGLKHFVDLLNECRNERLELTKLIKTARSRHANARAIFMASCLLIVGLFIPALRRRIHEAKEDVESLEEQLADCVVCVDARLEEGLQDPFSELHNAFDALRLSRAIFDITGVTNVTGQRGNGGASDGHLADPVTLTFTDSAMIKSDFKAMHFENSNGGDLYLYPGFVMMIESDGRFGLLDYPCISLELRESRNVQQQPPDDAEIVGETWAHVRKNGEPDRRFRDNWQVPIVRYARLDFTSEKGLQETWLFSSFQKANAFYAAFKEWQKVLN